MTKFNLFLPKTDFPLKRQRTESDLVDSITNLETTDYDWVLHDGPPYANGDLHMGHFLNKTKKDIVNRYQMTFKNKKVSYRPGWDCHGLPIEWKVEGEYSKENKDKNDDVLQFRKDCRAYANHWVKEQKEQFKSFGVMAEWDNCYHTHDFHYESKTLENLFKLQEKGFLEHRFKPIWWSPVEKTTLAEAEVELDSVEVESLFVEFEVENSDFSLLVWTTTPWTLPGNQAVAYNSSVPYVLATHSSGRKVVLSKNSYQCFSQLLKLSNPTSFDPRNLAGKFVFPPFKNNRSPLIDFDEVHEMVGTGLLHVVPGHGYVDFDLGVKYNLSLESLVDGDAMMEVDGKKVHVYKANQAVYEFLSSSNIIYHVGVRTESLKEISWRSKKPLIVKTSKNWYFNFSSFKDEMMKDVERVHWFHESLANRFKSMLHNRSDWCLSRQRLWGVPMALFLHKDTNEMLVDQTVNNNLVELFKNHGSDVWYEYDADYFLPKKYHGQYEKVMDVLDVWFDSGSSLQTVYPDLDQADLYLEGSDQHRGWFQSSALIHYALTGNLPFKAVYTHGFVTQNKMKMSKSLGSSKNSLNELLEHYGADVLRLLVSRSRTHNDIEITTDTLETSRNSYNKIRNTLRFCYGNLNGQTINRSVELRPFDLWALYKTRELLYDVDGYDHLSVLQIEQHCNWLSSVYFTAIKDSLYCDSKNSNDRQAILLTLDVLSRALLMLVSHLTPFMVEESRLLGFVPENLLDQFDYSNLGYWPFVEQELEEAKKAFEFTRTNKGWVMEEMTFRFKSNMPVDWKYLLGCAQYENRDYRGYHIEPFEGKKCLRCRSYHATVNSDELCQRCEDVENEFD